MARILKLDKEEKLQLHAEAKHVKCPVCEGAGKIFRPIGQCSNCNDIIYEKIKCLACKGNGVVSSWPKNY